jgi:truncated hemoglobin YjbI
VRVRGGILPQVISFADLSPTTVVLLIVVGVIVLVGVPLVIVILRGERRGSPRPPGAPVRIRVTRTPRTGPAGRANAVPTPPRATPTVRGPDDVIVPPPTVPGRTGKDDLREWLLWFAPDASWPEVVADFYRRAAADTQVASYFHRADMEELQFHFTAAITMLCKEGLTARALRAMTVRHANVTNRNGEHIHGAIFDKVVDTLVDVLSDVGVPDVAINELAACIDPLRAAIVVTEYPDSSGRG